MTVSPDSFNDEAGTNGVKRSIFLKALLLILISVLWVGAAAAAWGAFGGAVALCSLLSVFLLIHTLSGMAVLRLYRAQALSPGQAPEIFALLQEIASDAEMPLPRLYLIPSVHPNVLTVSHGRRKASIAVTEGLLAQLTAEEVKAVLAHEAAHILRHDAWMSTAAAAIAGALNFLESVIERLLTLGQHTVRHRPEQPSAPHPLVIFFKVIFYPLASLMIHGLVSADREYEADQWAGEI